MTSKIDIAQIRAKLDHKRLVGFDTNSTDRPSKSGRPLVGKPQPGTAPFGRQIVKSGKPLVGKGPPV